MTERIAATIYTATQCGNLTDSSRRASYGHHSDIGGQLIADTDLTTETTHKAHHVWLVPKPGVHVDRTDPYDMVYRGFSAASLAVAIELGWFDVTDSDEEAD